jgi:hypothetical protein
MLQQRAPWNEMRFENSSLFAVPYAHHSERSVSLIWNATLTASVNAPLSVSNARLIFGMKKNYSTFDS